MTLIAGFTGRGGSVLCSDLLEVQEGYAKKPVDKISLSVNAMNETSIRFQFAVGCSGSGPYMEMLQAELVRELESLSKSKEIALPELADIVCGALTDLLVKFYAKHIWPRSSSAPQAEMQFLVLIQPVPFGEPCIIKVAETAVNVINNSSYACIGIGSYLAEYILDSIFSGTGGKEYQIAIAAYVLNEVNKNVDGCGLGYSIYHFSENGKMDWSSDLFRPDDFSRIKSIFEYAFQTMTDLSEDPVSRFTPERLGELIESEFSLRAQRLKEENARRARFNKQISGKSLES